MVLEDINVQKNLVKRDGLVVDGRKYFFKFIGKFFVFFLLYCKVLGTNQKLVRLLNFKQ